MKDVAIRLLKYFLALTIFGIVAMILSIMSVNIDATTNGIISLVVLSIYLFSIEREAKAKNRSVLSWVLIGLFLTPFLGFSIFLLNRKESKLNNGDD